MIIFDSFILYYICSFYNLKIKTFKWKKSGTSSIGIIAQDLDALLPRDGKFDLVGEFEYKPTTIPDIEKLTIVIFINYLIKRDREYLLQKLENLEEIKQIKSYYSKGGLKTKKKNT